MKPLRIVLLLFVFSCLARAQTSSSIARHIGWGSSLPATCNPLTGDIFYLVNIGAVTGQQYDCTAANTWTAVNGSGTVTSVSGTCGISGTVTTSGSLSGLIALDSQTGAGAFAIPTSDCGKLIYRNNAAAVSDTIAQAGSGGSFPANWYTYYQCVGAGGCTITPTVSTIDGNASLTLATGGGVIIQSDGTNYRTFKGSPGAGVASQAFALNATTVTITSPLVNASSWVWCTDNGSPPKFVGYEQATVASGTAVVTFAGAAPSAGTCYAGAAGGGTPPSPLTTKGDIYGHSTVDARVPVGADATFFMADAAQGLGVKWIAPSGDFNCALTGVCTLASTAVTPGTYGDSTHVAQITVDAKGRLTAVSNVGISGGGGGATCTTGSTSSVGKLFIGSGSSTPCVYPANNADVQVTSELDLTIPGGTTGNGTIVVYINLPGLTLSADYSSTITNAPTSSGGAGLAAVNVNSVASPAYPTNCAIRLTTFTVTAGAITANNPVTPASGGITGCITPGNGISSTPSGATIPIAIDSTVPQKPATNVWTGSNDYSAGTMFKTNGIISAGTKFTTTGCSVSATTGGAAAGTYTSGTTGTCTVVITINGASGLTAPNGWACSASDRTTPADVQTNTTSTTTTATISGTTVSGDVVSFYCLGY